MLSSYTQHAVGGVASFLRNRRTAAPPVAATADVVAYEAPWVIVTTVLGLLAVCLLAGWQIGRWAVAGDRAEMAGMRVHRLELSFGQGYLDGSRLGRALADRATGPLDPEAMARAVGGSLQGAVDSLAARSEDYTRGFHEGVHGGMRQRMAERFGPPRAAMTALPPAPVPRPHLGAPRQLEEAGIRRVMHSDGSVEYTNL